LRAQPRTAAERIRRLARIVDSIQAQRAGHPDYALDIAEAIIDGELRKLAEESDK